MILAQQRVGGISTTVHIASLDSFVQPIDRMQIYRDGTTYRFAVGSKRADSRILAAPSTQFLPIVSVWLALLSVGRLRSLGLITSVGKMVRYRQSRMLTILLLDKPAITPVPRFAR